MSGFKSFANKMVLDFLPDCDIANGGRCGITAIVGPNGSGKSNVADAIRFAIGEQSSKNLRGKKSEDVIFAGTDKKTRLGVASVTLHFDNSDKRIPIEFAEVLITRKVYRSGESEYLINGAHVRLMDIVDLLAQAGIGKDSYCVITQGMSDAVLNASPVERRSIFEDAAGVKQYQIEKERALRKLESTRENVERADGLIAEIEPHLKNLRRQAEKASQGKDVAQKLREKQLLLYGFLWNSFQGERGALVTERDGMQKEVFDLEVETNTLSREVTEVSKMMEDQSGEEIANHELMKLREEANTFLRDRSIIEGKIEIEKEKQKEQEVVRVIPVDLEYVRKALEEIRANQQELIERIRSVEKLEDLQDIREFAQVIKQKLHDLDEKASEGSVKEKRIIALPDEEKKESDKRLTALTEERERLNKHLEVLQKTLTEKEASLVALREAGRKSREMFFVKEKEWREKEFRLTKLKDALNEVRVRLARVEVREEDLVTLVREELAMDASELTYKEAPVHETTQPIERERLEREIARLKVEVEHIGTIDPLVVEEYQETEKRFVFLTHESTDLKQAMESLRTVVKEMDQKIDEAFDEAFKEIRTKFSEYFKIIFGGGKAELEIVKIKRRVRLSQDTDENEEDGEDDKEQEGETELGIEIFACPPGKKITHLSMLSGGERSLTSLALLFAIISHNPPPFAILDEVEAALDEANSRRFSKMLQELSTHTQFIAITHNRETMSQAGLLYGVTMGADGVSQLLSIRLDQAEKLKS
ncbi:MAG: chromosome segregation protein SMC [Candidatus Moranbacteria bacterium]|nr:chromosome segregation protein SMC [Candidatus Moranbacteria bacterium]